MNYNELLSSLVDYGTALPTEQRSMLYFMIRDMEDAMRAKEAHIESRLCWCLPTVKNFTVDHEGRVKRLKARVESLQELQRESEEMGLYDEPST